MYQSRRRRRCNDACMLVCSVVFFQNARKESYLAFVGPDFQGPILPRKDPWLWEAQCVFVFLYFLAKYDLEIRKQWCILFIIETASCSQMFDDNYRYLQLWMFVCLVNNCPQVPLKAWLKDSGTNQSFHWLSTVEHGFQVSFWCRYCLWETNHITCAGLGQPIYAK